jgi:osmotically-inducible protein OsmY
MRDEACQVLQRDGEVDASEIEVTCENSVITLTGTVQDRQSKRRAEQCAESVYGITDVMNELRIEPRTETNPAHDGTASLSA